MEESFERTLGNRIISAGDSVGILELLGTGLYLLGILLASLFIVTFIIQRTTVDGQSMEPTLQNNDNLFVDKLSYRFHDPERFEVIVLRPFADQKDVLYIKRIIALPGETIQITKEGDILINHQKLEDPYGKEIIKPENIGRASEPITLGEDEYFVMGDNRNNSGDSRSKQIGNIHRSQIIGRAWIRIWPFSKFGKVK